MSKVLIIGGGVAGLSAGIYARMAGLDAVICEKHSVPGGNLTGWQRGGYHIDNCIHWLTGTNPATDTYKMWEELGALGGGVGIRKIETLFSCERGGETLAVYRDLEKTRREMLNISPADKKEIEALFSAVKTVQGLSGLSGEEHNENYGFIKTALTAPSLLKYYRLTTGELAKRFSHPLIKSFLTSFLTDRFMSLALVIVIAHFCGENANLPVGGSLDMARRMAERFERLGGEIQTKKEVVGINRYKNRAVSVTFADGSEADADHFIITADPASVFGQITDVPMPKALRRSYENKRLIRFSCCHTAFSCDVDVPIKGDFAFEIPESYRLRMGADHIILREFSHEKDFSPSGKSLIQTMTFCSEKYARNLIELRRDRDEYEKRKESIASMTQRMIEEKFPQLVGKLKCIDVWTPATYNRYLGAEMGAFMGFAISSNVIPTRKSNKIKGFSNVLLAGQWLRAPGGLPIAAASGKRAAEILMKKEGLRFLAAGRRDSEKQLGYGTT